MENISYAPIIGALKNNLAQKKQLEAKTRKLTNSLYEAQNLYVQMINAQKLLSTISDDNTRQTLDFITGMVNKVMSEILPNDPHHIKLPLFSSNPISL